MTERESGSSQRLIEVTLDETSILKWNAEVAHERRVAITDLLADNRFAPVGPLPRNYEGPFRLHLRLEEGRLVFELSDRDGGFLKSFRLPLMPFRRIVKSYFEICDSYYRAVRDATTQRIEALDMGRRGLHNDGSSLLREQLRGKVDLDENTARRLFTLICVLHIRS